METMAMEGLFWARHYPDYVDQMLKWLGSAQANLNPGDRGTKFYFLGIAAFASHDYQTATFFFDAAASEDFKVQNTDSQPAHLFMYLDSTNPKQAGLEIVKLIVGKLHLAIADYNGRRKVDFRQHCAQAFLATSDAEAPDASENADNDFYFIFGGVGL